MKHVNIPVFVPHLGCPHDCVFCNQKTITGVREFDIARADEEIAKALSTIDRDNTEVEIAFFGGSFTGIERDLMLSLLSISDKYFDRGLISSVRCSTRPDYIDGEILDILKEHHVGTIEIGVQSMSDKVLEASMRGHNSMTTENACRLIVGRGFELVGQMMIGLPMSTPQDEIMTAERICALGATVARIYPTVVFYGTALCDMSRDLRYTPLSVEEAVERTSDVLEVFINHDVVVVRIGLCESDGLHDENGIYAGAFHPALGEMCVSRYYLKRFVRLLSAYDGPLKNVTLLTARGSLSKAIGQHKTNRKKLEEKFPSLKISFGESCSLNKYEIRLLTDNGESKCV